MRCNLLQAGLWALFLPMSVVAEEFQLQPLGSEYAGCGCALVDGPLFSNADVLLFQDVDDAATATVRLNGRDIRLIPSAGALSAEWGAKVGTPVTAEFSSDRYQVRFAGKVVKTCYETESCEAIWYEGVLHLSKGAKNVSKKVTGACGC